MDAEKAKPPNLMDPLPSSRIRKGLVLPEGVQIKTDTANEMFVALNAQDAALVQRPWKQVYAWRKPGQTFSFVVKHAIHTRLESEDRSRDAD